MGAAPGGRFGRRAALGGLLTLTSGTAGHGAEAGLADPRGTFPLKAVPGQRYLQDSAGRPYLIRADSAWSLIAQLRLEEVEVYLRDRQARGFNALLVELIEHLFARNAPANAYGDAPFLVPGDFTTPNDAYFAHADRVLLRAAEMGFLVLLTPSFLGINGGEEGWYREMTANGAAKLSWYGEYLGQRYQKFKNILWVQGGDRNPPEKSLVRAIANGIRHFDTDSLHTAHCAPETPALTYWAGEPWLQVNNVYTYGPVYKAALAQYARPERRPFFLIESTYENEHEATEQLIRAQTYQALLCGASGYAFGNNPLWYFSAPQVRHPLVQHDLGSWVEALDSRGSQSMQHLHRLFLLRPWWLLEPDIGNRLLTGRRFGAHDGSVAACASDGSFALVYVAAGGTATVYMGAMRGPSVRTRWYDPASGRFSEFGDRLFRTENVRHFRPPKLNEAGFTDWVLVLESDGTAGATSG